MLTQLFSTGQMAKKLNVTNRTLINWDKSGKLKARRTPTNRRYYTLKQYQQVMNIQPNDESHRLQIAYARVSSHNQKDDLKNQVNFIQNYVNAKGIILDKTMQDVGSGLNYNRKQWNQLIDLVMQNKVDTVYITYQDRFIRFGYHWFECLLHKFNTDLVVLNAKQSSPNEEFVQDIISIIHVFSCRLYGLRKYKNKIKSDKTIEKEEHE